MPGSTGKERKTSWWNSLDLVIAAEAKRQTSVSSDYQPAYLYWADNRFNWFCFVTCKALMTHGEYYYRWRRDFLESEDLMHNMNGESSYMYLPLSPSDASASIAIASISDCSCSFNNFLAFSISSGSGWLAPKTFSTWLKQERDERKICCQMTRQLTMFHEYPVRW